MIVNEVGQRIKQLRTDKGITQEQMAKHFGVNQSNYSRLEKDDNRISIVQIKIFAKVLGTTTDYLLTGNEMIEYVNNITVDGATVVYHESKN